MKRKTVIYLLLTALLVAGCSKTGFADGEFLTAEMDSTAILLGTASKAMTRSATGLETYEGTMKVYAAKKMIATDKYDKVFGNYVVWNTSQDPSVAGDWDYVAEKDEVRSVIKDGKAATPGNLTIPQKQVKKYWDYKASEYLFWAVAPYNEHVTFNVPAAGSAGEGTVTHATVTGIGGHLTANNTSTATQFSEYYLARPVKVLKANYGDKTANNPVKFTFDHMHAWVRVGFYETISNHKIKNITFYNNEATPVGGQNIVLNREVAAFVGGNNGTATITYDNTGLAYGISYTGLTAQKWIQFGKLAEIADPSDYAYMLKLWGHDGDMSASTFYFHVLPTPAALVGNDSPITLTLDFTLQGEDAAAEEIIVRGVKATVPSEFSTWVPNHAYTYVFKITEAALNLKKIEFDAEASNITDMSTEHEEELI